MQKGIQKRRIALLLVGLLAIMQMPINYVYAKELNVVSESSQVTDGKDEVAQETELSDDITTNNEVTDDSETESTEDKNIGDSASDETTIESTENQSAGEEINEDSVIESTKDEKTSEEIAEDNVSDNNANDNENVVDTLENTFEPNQSSDIDKNIVEDKDSEVETLTAIEVNNIFASDENMLEDTNGSRYINEIKAEKSSSSIQEEKIDEVDNVRANNEKSNLDAVIYAWNEEDVRYGSYYYEPKTILYGGTDRVSVNYEEVNYAGSVSFGTERYYFDNQSSLYDSSGNKVYDYFTIVINPLYDNITNANYDSERASMSDYVLKRTHYWQWSNYLQAKQAWIAGLQNYNGSGDQTGGGCAWNPDIDDTNMYQIETYTDIMDKYIDDRICFANVIYKDGNIAYISNYAFADAIADFTNRSGYLVSYLNQDGVFYAFKTGVISFYTEMDELNYRKVDMDCSYTEYITFTIEDIYNAIIAKLPSVESVSLNTSKVSLAKGETTKLTATVLPDYATNKDVTWSSSNEQVATVTSDGNVKAVDTGSAVITAIAQDGSNITATCKVTVLKSYKITYKLNKGTNAAANPTYYAKGSKVKFAKPTRKNYTFVGWYRGDTKVTSISKTTTGKITLTAKWTKVSVAKTIVNSAQNSKAGKITAKFDKVSDVKGYTVYYSTSKNLKDATTINISSKNKTATITGLTKGTTYYVTVKAYKYDSEGNKVYGKSNKTIKVKVKK